MTMESITTELKHCPNNASSSQQASLVVRDIAHVKKSPLTIIEGLKKSKSARRYSLRWRGEKNSGNAAATGHSVVETQMSSRSGHVSFSS